jgi:hypothetical protein
MRVSTLCFTSVSAEQNVFTYHFDAGIPTTILEQRAGAGGFNLGTRPVVALML